MPLPDGVHTVRYTLRAYDPDEEVTHLDAALTLPFRGSNVADVDAAIAAGVEAIIAQLQPGIPVPILANRVYDCTVPGDPWPAPEVP